jgi:hypothetical protein
MFRIWIGLKVYFGRCTVPFLLEVRVPRGMGDQEPPALCHFGVEQCVLAQYIKEVYCLNVAAQL